MEGNDSRKTTIFKSQTGCEALPLDIRIAAFAIAEGGRYHIRRHIHPEYEIMIPLTGCYRSILNGKLLEVHPDEFILIQAGDDHEDLCEGEFRFAALRFCILDSTGTERTLPILNKALSPEKRIFPLRKESIPSQLCQQAFSAFSGENPFQKQSVGPLTHAMFWELLALIPPESFAEEFREAFHQNQLLSRLEHLFATRLNQPLTVDRIAALLGMSRRVLEYQLKRLGAPSPLRLFTRSRIQEAVQLLKYEGLNVSQTAERLGFANPFHFSRVFKSVTGRTPGDFRNHSSSRN